MCTGTLAYRWCIGVEAMVCDKCQEKQKAKGQSGNIVPDRWKEGATNHGKVAAGDKRISSKELHNPYTKTKER